MYIFINVYLCGHLLFVLSENMTTKSMVSIHAIYLGIYLLLVSYAMKKFRYSDFFSLIYTLDILKSLAFWLYEFNYE